MLALDHRPDAALADDATAAGRAPGKRTLTQGLAPSRGGPPPAQPSAAAAAPAALDDPYGLHLLGPAVELPHRAALERRFGLSLDGVIAHVGPAAQAASRDHGADGLAIGNHVAFADADPSLAVVAHEVTHALQQTRGGGAGDEADDEREAHAAEHGAIANGFTAAAGAPALRLRKPHAKAAPELPDAGDLANRIRTVLGTWEGAALEGVHQFVHEELAHRIHDLEPRSLKGYLRSLAGNTMWALSSFGPVNPTTAMAGLIGSLIASGLPPDLAPKSYELEVAKRMTTVIQGLHRLVEADAGGDAAYALAQARHGSEDAALAGYLSSRFRPGFVHLAPPAIAEPAVTADLRRRTTALLVRFREQVAVQGPADGPLPDDTFACWVETAHQHLAIVRQIGSLAIVFVRWVDRGMRAEAIRRTIDLELDQRNGLRVIPAAGIVGLPPLPTAADERRDDDDPTAQLGGAR